MNVILFLKNEIIFSIEIASMWMSLRCL